MSVIPDKIKLIEIELLEFSIKTPGEANSSLKHVPSLNIGMHHDLMSEENLLTFIYEGKLDLKNEKEETICESHFKYEFIINVENLDDFKTGEGEAVKYDPIIALTCIGITYSTGHSI